MYQFTTLLAWGTVIAQVAIVLLVVIRITNIYWLRQTKHWLQKYGSWVAAIVLVVATAGPLVYSEAFSLPPCDLCWYQRIFMFSGSIMLIMANFKRQVATLRPYLLTLLTIGAGIGIFHYTLQRGIAHTEAFCSPLASGASCSTMYILEFGYITIPVMSVTAFILGIVLLSFKNDKSTK